ncbi:DM9 repeat-containing protein [Afifella sp. IM 167]|uniref:DM9 repeat-containing protein n=1 Tax=Afifella sp. IM 167 TaxID=2033586 RepID=UPI001CCE4C14|nr:DM9 repeat-containing protein [Afifella sp. IM 167]MBZ8134330.1 hypothetical protein [Afifella sp. IM 167]
MLAGVAFLAAALAPPALAQGAFASKASRDTDVGLRWVDVTNSGLPKDPVIGGNLADGTPLYVCRVVHMRDTESGKREGPDGHACLIGTFGMERPYSTFESLAGPMAGDVPAGAKWVAAAPGKVPEGAFRIDGGHGPKRFLCRASYQGGVHPGVIEDTPEGDVCHIGWKGDELQNDAFEVLVFGD